MITAWQAKRFAEEHGIPVAEHLGQWRQWVEMKIMQLTLDAHDLVEMSQEEPDEINSELYAIWAGDLFMDIYRYQKELKRMTTAINPVQTPKPGAITDEMIERAREYPVENLVEFVRGKAKAWCHDDRNPSMFHGTRNNIVVCPVCDKKFGPIDVLVTRDGMTFRDAVLTLA
jgi:hypothetical protein